MPAPSHCPWPHEYIVRAKVDDNLSDRIVQHIRGNGFEANFYDKLIKYFEEDGLLYWTMGSPIEKTTIVNRCKTKQSYDYRLRNGIILESSTLG